MIKEKRQYIVNVRFTKREKDDIAFIAKRLAITESDAIRHMLYVTKYIYESQIGEMLSTSREMQLINSAIAEFLRRNGK